MNLFQQLFWLRRFGSVRRFHGQRMTHDETVFHHSASVALIILQAFPETSAALLKAALKHDLEEGVMGDIPGPVKWRIGMLPFMRQLEKSVKSFFHLSTEELSDEEHKILKAADFLDATMNCLCERLKGNREIDWVFTNYTLNAYRRPGLAIAPFAELWETILESYKALVEGEPIPEIDAAEEQNFWSSVTDSVPTT